MGAHSSQPLWSMLQLGAPRPRGRVPLSSTRQVGLARTGPSGDLEETRGSLIPACAWFRLSGSPGDEGRAGQGWLDHRRAVGWGQVAAIRHFPGGPPGPCRRGTGLLVWLLYRISTGSVLLRPPPPLREEVGWWEGSLNIFGGSPSRLVHPLGNQRLLGVMERGQDCIMAGEPASIWGVTWALSPLSWLLRPLVLQDPRPGGCSTPSSPAHWILHWA